MKADLFLTDEELAALSPEASGEYMRLLEAELGDLRRRGWRARARPEQIPPEGDWRTLLLRGGRGSGKSWAGARVLCELIQTDPLRATDGPGQWAVIAPTFGSARDLTIEAPESGLLAALGTTLAEVNAGASAAVELWNRSLGELRLRDGSTVVIDGADDGAVRIQGRSLRGCWCDEVGLWKNWQRAWDESLAYALRKGDARTVVTGTPKADMPARELVRRLIADPDVVDRRLTTWDNAANLSPAFLEGRKAAIGTRLGRQELEGELLEDVVGALWQRAWIDDQRVPEGSVDLRDMKTIVVGLDPADGTATGDEQGLAAVGVDRHHHFYVLRSAGTRATALQFLSQSVRTAREISATRIVVEKNHGGAFLVGMLDQAMDALGVRVAYKVVTASQGKRTRAEPVAALYEQGRVHHVGVFEELEEQLVTWTGNSSASPDRLDALAWTMLDLMGSGYSHTSGLDEPDQIAVPYTTDLRGGDGAVPWEGGMTFGHVPSFSG